MGGGQPGCFTPPPFKKKILNPPQIAYKRVVMLVPSWLPGADLVPKWTLKWSPNHSKTSSKPVPKTVQLFSIIDHFWSNFGLWSPPCVGLQGPAELGHLPPGGPRPPIKRLKSVKMLSKSASSP